MSHRDWRQVKHAHALVTVLAAVILAFTGLLAAPARAYASTPGTADTPGKVVAWGSNRYKQLGYRGYDNLSPIPVDVDGLIGVTAIAAGWNTGYALLENGTVKAWGWNDLGQLGINPSTYAPDFPGTIILSAALPVTVSDLTDPTGNLQGVKAIASGCYSGYALLKNSTVKAWGDNSDGQLGDGSTENRLTPVDVVVDPNTHEKLENVKAIAAGEYSAYALLTNSTVKAWGANGSGQLGNGSITSSPNPVGVDGLTGVTAIAAGYNSAYALLTNGTVKAWGANGSGQLGNGSITSSPNPVGVDGLTGVTAIAAGYNSAYALLTNGTVKAWGANTFGQLGDGTNTDSSRPVDVVVDPNTHEKLENVKAIAAGEYSAYALLTNGTVKAWGANTFGQLGNGRGGDGTQAYDSWTPVTVSSLYALAIAAGSASGYAIVPIQYMNPPDFTLSVSVTKAWVGEPADSVTIALLADGEYAGKTLTLSGANNWQGSFNNLPEYDSDGHEIAYTISETPVTGYSSEIAGDADSGFTVTNTRNTRSVSVTKSWVGGTGEPTDSVTIHLLADGQDTGKTVELSEANIWQGSFNNLPEYDSDGHEIAYTISETPVTGYSSEIAGDADAGFTVTNTYMPSPNNGDTTEKTEPPSSSDNGDTFENDGETSETGETGSDTTLPQTGKSDSPVEILSFISASLLAAGTALSIARRRSASTCK